MCGPTRSDSIDPGDCSEQRKPCQCLVRVALPATPFAFAVALGRLPAGDRLRGVRSSEPRRERSQFIKRSHHSQCQHLTNDLNALRLNLLLGRYWCNSRALRDRGDCFDNGHTHPTDHRSVRTLHPLQPVSGFVRCKRCISWLSLRFGH